MEFETLTIDDPRYPRRLLERLGTGAPTLYFHGPLKLLDRFTMAVIAGDQIAGQAMIATNDMLFKIREYALNYIGPWHSVMETEIFRLALDTPTDRECRRSLTICTARGLGRESWDNFLGDRFGYEGPFIGFPQKEEFYRRAREEELLWLSITDPQQKRFERRNILLRNRVACALADVVFVPFSEKGAKSLITVKQVLKDKVPIFTCQYGPDKETDVNKDLFSLGIPSYPRKTVGKYLESLGARTDAPPPFPPKPDVPPEMCDAGKEPVAPSTKFRQISFL
jgi:predicted Rossmann fold nucleotide-binding protein DprA/Smf involved in DNA uptake